MLGQVTVIGGGLIGGSLVKALRARGGAERICAVDVRGVLAEAAGFVDEVGEAGSTAADSLVASSDLVVLAMPIGAIIATLDSVLATVRKGAVVTDTGSVKKPIVAAARSHANATSFVAGHPMAGREVGGFEASTADLFEGARWFLVADDDDRAPSDASARSKVVALAEAVGALPLSLGARAHDRAMSYVSHAPQLIASAVYSVAARAGVLAEAGPGFRDVTRISGAPVATWRDIFQTNSEEIASALGEILEPLIEVRRLLSTGDEGAIASALALLEQAHSAKLKRQADLRPKSEPSR